VFSVNLIAGASQWKRECWHSCTSTAFLEGVASVPRTMVVLARQAARRLCQVRTASSKSAAMHDPRTLRAAWSFLQRANPFTVWGETVGREPSDRLPSVSELVKAVVGISGKSPDELATYATESNAAFEAYVDDLGFERRSLLEIAPKDEAQSLDEFLEGAQQAVSFVAPLLKDASAHEVELSNVVSTQLLAKAKDGMSATHGDDADVRRVTFGVYGAQLRAADLAPKSSGMMALFERLLQKWAYEGTTQTDAVVLRESSGLFVAKFALGAELAELLNAAKEADTARAVDALLYACSRTEGRALTWPLPSDALSRLQGDTAACALTMRGWLLVDVNVASCLYTFAREVDGRADYRWGHDWRIVDIDGAVFNRDDGALLDGLVAETE